MAADRQRVTAPTERQFRFMLPPPRDRENAAIAQRTVRWLGIAFWCSLLGTTLAVGWAIHCGLEIGRAAQRVTESQAEGERVEAAAVNKLALAKSKLSEQRKMADDDHRKKATQSESPTFSLKERFASGQLEIDPYQAQIVAAQQDVEVARQAVDDSLIAVDRRTRDAWLHEKQSQRLLFWSMTAVAVGAVVSFTTGWVWRRAE
jgi:hypothetical protein